MEGAGRWKNRTEIKSTLAITEVTGILSTEGEEETVIGDPD